MSKHSDKYHILLLSSRPLSHSAGLGQQIVNSLQLYGHKVDFLTRYKSPNMKENEKYVERLSIYGVINNHIKIITEKLGVIKHLRKLKKFIYKLFRKPDTLYTTNSGLIFMYEDEASPDVPAAELLKKINHNYDAVITLFWQDMLSSTSLKAISDRLKCPILIFSPDMAPLTGGCYYFGECTNYQNGCGMCPALKSNLEFDQSKKNYLLKKDNYESMNCAFLGNSWMNQHAIKSKLFNNIKKLEIIIDENIFKPNNKTESRNSLHVSNYSFIILLRSTNEPRKGNLDILKAIELFLHSVPKQNKKDILVLTIGDNYFKAISNSLSCEVKHLGKVVQTDLIQCYQASDVFINASYDDAGPSMINQSIMCGTPVVCYDNGTACDVIENNMSGFKTKTGNIMGLKDGLLAIYNLSEENKIKLRNTSRNMALIHNSSETFSQNVTDIITSMKKKMYNSN